jgi:hypothetical protein
VLTPPSVRAALAALTHTRSIEAGNLLGTLRSELVAADLPAVIDRVIDLASGEEYDRWQPPPAPAALVAAAQVDLEVVTSRVVAMLASENEWARHIAADAAGVLLQTDPIRALSGRSPHAACFYARPATGKKSEEASR